MPKAPVTSFIAECFWAGVKDGDLRLLDERAAATVTALAGAGEQVRYLGSILMRTDEVVLCLFEGTAASVQRAAEKAGIPFERILESAGSAWAAAASPRLEKDGD